MERSKTLQQCEKTTIQSPLLETLVHGILGNENARGGENRQRLSFILRSALGVVRLPGTSDIKFDEKHFRDLDREDVMEAIEDARRIYWHTQKQFEAHWPNGAIALRRGINGREAEAIAAMNEMLEGPTIPFFLSTLTFFNHVSGAFTSDLTIVVDCPVKWVWACEYTLENLVDAGYGVQNSCEEFIVCCTDMTGCIEIPKTNIEVNARYNPEEYKFDDWLKKGASRDDIISRAMSNVAHHGFEPEFGRRQVTVRRPGPMEYRLQKLGNNIDRALGKLGFNTRPAIKVEERPRNTVDDRIIF